MMRVSSNRACTCSRVANRDQALVAVTLMGGMSLVGLAVSVLISLLLSRSLSGSLSQVSGLLERLAGGDLGGRASARVLKRRDELGKLGKNADSLAVSLETSVRGIAEVGTSLKDLATAAITQRVSGVEEKVTEQVRRTASSELLTREIIAKLEVLDIAIENQFRQVSDSSASTEQILGNIQSLNAMVGEMDRSFSLLLASSEDGRNKLSSMGESVRRISEESERLQEANEMVKNIADQTNLLAMNAAIEAAHAGDAGRGFAVVAEEIRKLAELSSVQSREINADIQSIQGHIQTVASDSGVTEESIALVIDQIGVLGKIERTLTQAVAEQSEGSRQILEATSKLEQITFEVRDGSTHMLSDSRTIGQEMAALGSLSADIRQDLAEILRETNAITATLDAGTQLGLKNTEMSLLLRDEVDKFTLARGD